MSGITRKRNKCPFSTIQAPQYVHMRKIQASEKERERGVGREREREAPQYVHVRKIHARKREREGGRGTERDIYIVKKEEKKKCQPKEKKRTKQNKKAVSRALHVTEVKKQRKNQKDPPPKKTTPQKTHQVQPNTITPPFLNSVSQKSKFQ